MKKEEARDTVKRKTEVIRENVRNKEREKEKKKRQK